ncbi:hypothetical protein [Mycoplasmopsis felis]|uniref:hypothetical protein n=1 Tax=Mycoplasmopsis felis TaxID=33923 RepID=UPI002AFE1485|nr:hypothetical protein [Mycoplasmopsis felis]WQQ03311.1 hypothetical protein RRG38_00330 [Mycoplasmopsis felis]
MKLKKIKYLFLLSSSITIIPAIAMSCDKNEEPGKNTGTTDKQVTPPIPEPNPAPTPQPLPPISPAPGNGGQDSKTPDNDNPTVHANENLIEEIKTNPLQRVEGITDQQIYDKIFSKFTNETKIRGLQVYNVDNNVFIGISGGGNDVDNKLFKAKKDDFYNLLTDWDNKDTKNIQKRFNHSEWDNENKTLIFRYKIKGNKEDQVYEQRFTLNVELKEFNPPKKEQPSNTEKPTTSTEKPKPIEAPVVENADIKVNPLQKITEVSDQKIYDKIQSMLKSKNNIFPGIQKYTDKTVKFFGILSGSNKDDNKLFTYTNPDFDAKIIPATENSKKNNNRFPESTWDEATKTLVFKYKIKDDTDNTIYEQSFKLEIQSKPDNSGNSRQNGNGDNSNTQPTESPSEVPSESPSNNIHSNDAPTNKPEEPTDSETPAANVSQPSNNEQPSTQPEPAVDPGEPSPSLTKYTASNINEALRLKENVTNQTIIDQINKVLNRNNKKNKFEGLQLYKVNSEVFLGIANGGNKVDNKLFELTDPSLESKFKYEAKPKNKSRNPKTSFPKSTWDKATKTLVFKYTLNDGTEHEQTFNLN